jgi:arylsulfatase A-like enzyme
MSALYAGDHGKRNRPTAKLVTQRGVAIAVRARHRDGVTQSLPAIVLGFAAALAAAGCNGRESARSGFATCKDCNVVLVSVDTLRADHVGAYGYPKPVTPNIDALARRGVLFENAISQSSWTRPAHMSIFTGLHPREHGFVALADTRRLEDSVPTLASVLRGKGFRTAAFVGGVNLAPLYGFDQGFDVYRTNGKYFRDNLEDVRYWLETETTGGQPFFLFLHGYDAHTPYLTDPVDRQALALPEGPPTVSLGETCRAGGDRSRVDPFRREYEGAVHRADRYVGKLVRELETRGLLERTIVVLLSDHGEEFLEHDRCFHIATVYREVLHVPLILVAPGLEPRRVAAPVAASVPIAATILEMAGIEGHPIPGESLLAAALGGPAPEAPIVSETERNAPNKGEGHVRALTTASHKLIHWTTQQKHALFDVNADPAEQRPVDDSGLRHELDEELGRWTSGHGPKHPARRRENAKEGEKAVSPGGQDEHYGDDSPESEQERRRREEDLRSLGYAD